ncbi:coatomer subunit gamma-2, partial [Tanacetum coccineum]
RVKGSPILVAWLSLLARPLRKRTEWNKGKLIIMNMKKGKTSAMPHKVNMFTVKRIASLNLDFFHSAMRMNFLSNILREEGGFEYKKAIVDSIVILIKDIPDAKESGLLHLCEFIEDCKKVKKAVLTHWNKLKGNLIPVKKVASLLQVCC